MTTGKNILTAKNVNFPHKHIIADLSTLTYKWDNVPVNEWTEYADKYDIPYKELFSDLSERGLLNPVIVRDLKNNGVLRKYHCGGRRIIWAKRQGYTHISAYIVSDWISEEGRKEIDTIVNDQWFRID
jgi:hypothetical protein|tara:strand:+ start:732 stop:1115 length:384 start_codon:yes stop_codon:yes gene_type:complete